MISIDVRIIVEPGGPTRKTGLRIQSANGTDLVNVYLDDRPPEQKKLLQEIFEGTGRYLGSLSGSTQ